MNRPRKLLGMEKGSPSSSSSSSSSGSEMDSLYYGGAPAAKKGRNEVVQPGGQPPRCQVEGCQVDLSDAKAYYSRHKVCGMHSKSPMVTVGGLQQRFCQQCSRFHQLPEFDQRKRSCRRRLAGHNERRRKPPPGPLLPSPYRSLSPSMLDSHSKTGGLVIDFGSYHLSSGTQSWLDTTSEWGRGNQAAATYQLPLHSSSQNSFPDLLQVSLTQPGYSCPGVSSEECLTGVSNTAGALSLLSNEDWTSTGKFSTNNFLETNSEARVHQPPSGPGSSTSQFLDLSWGYKAHEMLPGTGLDQGSNWDSSQYSRDSLSLARLRNDDSQFAQLGSEDDSVPARHMYWSP